MLKITVNQGGWEWQKIKDIEKVLDRTISYIQKELRSPIDGEIYVKNSEKGPKVLLRKPPKKGPFIILLSAEENYWIQYSYQFAHEFCHVLSGYENLYGNDNEWFHESICHVASLFTLCMISNQLKEIPSGSVSDDPLETLSPLSCTKYINNIRKRAEKIRPQNKDFINWLASKEEKLRENPISKVEDHKLEEKLRGIYNHIALELLPLFKKCPKKGWNAVTQLPDTNPDSIKNYLEEWHSVVNQNEKLFVQSLRKQLVGL